MKPDDRRRMADDSMEPVISEQSTVIGKSQRQSQKTKNSRNQMTDDSMKPVNGNQ
jgi:hypothetical protein